VLIVHDDDNVPRPNPVDDQDELLQLRRAELPLLDHLGRGARGVELGEGAVQQAELVERVLAQQSRGVATPSGGYRLVHAPITALRLRASADGAVRAHVVPMACHNGRKMAVSRGTSRSALVPFHLHFRVEPLITRSHRERSQRRSRRFESAHLHTVTHSQDGPFSLYAARGSA
jgi:hypothetical protein